MSDPGHGVLQRFFKQLRGTELKHHALAAALQDDPLVVQTLLYQTLAAGANAAGEYFTAHALAETGLQQLQQLAAHSSSVPLPSWPLRKEKAVALARSGAFETARRELLTLRHEGGTGASIALGPLARTYKDEALESNTLEQRSLLLCQGLELAHEGIQKERNAYNLGQAAQWQLLLGNLREAHRLAGETRDQSLFEFESQGEVGIDTFWHLTNLAEMALVEGRIAEAKLLYQQMVKEHGAGDRSGDLLANLKVCRILLDAIDQPAHLFDECFFTGSLCVFSGHIIDQPHRSQPRFPESAVPIAEKKLSDRLDELNCQVGVCSLAAGADILFAEQVLKRGADLHVILAAAPVESRRVSVVGPGGEAWGTRFDRILNHPQTRRVKVLKHLEGMGDSVAFQFLNQMLAGTARLRAEAQGLELVPLVLWDGEPGLPGGTGSFVRLWQRLETKVLVVPPLDVVPAQAGLTSMPQLDASTASQDQSIKALLFADVVGYSQLPGSVFGDFARHFLNGIHEILMSQGAPPLHQNTWGDALFLVYESASDAAQVALCLRNWMEQAPWHQWLPQRSGEQLPQLRLRTGLHLGPVHHVYDPVARQKSFMGTATNLAARVEPAAEEGQIFCTEEFAAALTLECTPKSHFRLEYQGIAPLPKKAGRIPVYRLSPGRYWSATTTATTTES